MLDLALSYSYVRLASIDGEDLDHLVNRPVVDGRVIAFNFNPLHRDLNRGDQRLLWNALLNWEAIRAPRSAMIRP